LEENRDKLSEDFASFVRGFRGEEGQLTYLDQLRDLPIRGGHSLVVDFQHLVQYEGALASSLEENPRDMLKLFSESGLLMLTELDMEFARKVQRFNVRVSNYQRRASIRSLNSSYIGRMVSITGVIVRSSEVMTQLKTGAFRCTSCQTVTPADQVGSLYTTPRACPVCNRSGPGTFELEPSQSTFEDFQSISLQERPEDLPAGQMPQTLDLALTDDLVSSARPGDRVVVTGIVTVKQRAAGFGRLRSRVFELSLDTNHIAVETEEQLEMELDEESIRSFRADASQPWHYKKLISSVAPSIHGLENIKEAVLLQLAGGNPKEFKDGIKVRGDVNVLLVGDPGTAKSQLLKYIQKIAPRGLYTSGRGATAAGLTAAAIRDESGAFSLEAGALVLADKGLAAIDEFEKMREEDRVAIHEAMEQQTCSIAKGGIVATLNARTSILAAANPQFGRYDLNRNFAENVNLSPVILSRFDLYFVLRDVPEETRDALLTEHIIAQHRKIERAAEATYDTVYLKRYVAYAKTLTPRLSDESAQSISKFFLELRKAGGESSIQITPRQLESLIRESEARAKLMLRDIVMKEDVEVVIALFRSSLSQAGLDVETGKTDIDILMTGKARSSWEKHNVIVKIAEDLEKEFGSANIEEVLKRAEGKGVDRADGRRIVNDLLRNGYFYTPDDVSLKKTR